MLNNSYTDQDKKFDRFIEKLFKLHKDDPSLLNNTLANIFSMRIFGNKTHGDLAEVAMTGFVNRYIKGYEAEHVGKKKFRSKESEEDILVIPPSDSPFSISLKAYGVGPLQLSTNKDNSMYNLLNEEFSNSNSKNKAKIASVLARPEFHDFREINVLPLIYDEDEMKCNVMIFDIPKAYSSAKFLRYIGPGGNRKHPVYRFYTKNDQYIFEVRYGGVAANALQRGLWTHTLNAEPFFNSVTDWISYDINDSLLELFQMALVSSKEEHEILLDTL